MHLPLRFRGPFLQQFSRKLLTGEVKSLLTFTVVFNWLRLLFFQAKLLWKIAFIHKQNSQFQ